MPIAKPTIGEYLSIREIRGYSMKVISTASRAIRLPEVCNLTSLSISTVWRKCQEKGPYFDPDFPKPFHLSEGVTAWDEKELLSWIDSKKSNVVQFKRKKVVHVKRK